MTDNEIIKALKATASWVCDECKFHGEMCDGDKCEKVIAENALDFINRQKAEIERLEKELMKCKLEKEMMYQVADEIKSVAIKDFAERLKRRYESVDGQYIDRVLNTEIDNLVKEMTEVEE